eukprot:7810199-Pyramimonas_sp.AAC.1
MHESAEMRSLNEVARKRDGAAGAGAPARSTKAFVADAFTRCGCEVATGLSTSGPRRASMSGAGLNTCRPAMCVTCASVE